jgi:hypothetical protein
LGGQKKQVEEGGEEAHRLREDPFHDELRRGGGREGEGTPPGRRGVGWREGAAVAVELARGVLGDWADERGRRRRQRRGPERAAGGAPGAGEELKGVERRLRRPQLAGGAGPRVAHGRVSDECVTAIRGGETRVCVSGRSGGAGGQVPSGFYRRTRLCCRATVSCGGTSHSNFFVSPFSCHYRSTSVVRPSCGFKLFILAC